MGKRVLLIDGDVLAYRAAASCEKAVHWGEGFWTWHVEWDDVLNSFDHQLDKIVSDLEADDFKLCLTDSDGNFRKEVYRSYKGKRGNTKKPLVLSPFKQYLIDERDAYFRPTLEGDDCMGILATRSNPTGEERIIVSIDKDMKTIPGLYYNDAKPDEGVIAVSEEDADLWFLTQTLTGDVTDGYPGCPGIGKVKAERLLADNPDPWASIVAAYEKAGLTEDDAIVQARCARILRASDYDFKRKEPILWTP